MKAFQQVVQSCKIRLLEIKSDLIESLREARSSLSSRTYSGDEADLSVEAIAENHLYADHQRIRERLLAVERALGLIERGSYGICEETGEPIEPDRLLAIPWTTLSIEGAEIREGISRRKISGSSL